MTLRDAAPQGAVTQFVFAALSFGALADACQAVTRTPSDCGKSTRALKNLDGAPGHLLDEIHPAGALAQTLAPPRRAWQLGGGILLRHCLPSLETRLSCHVRLSKNEAMTMVAGDKREQYEPCDGDPLLRPSACRCGRPIGGESGGRSGARRTIALRISAP
jgi:hypothetical protein